MAALNEAYPRARRWRASSGNDRDGSAVVTPSRGPGGGWQNGARWPGAADAGLASAQPLVDRRRERQQTIIRVRELTHAGNGIDAPVPTSATTFAVTFPQSEVDTAYGVTLCPNWNTTSAVTARTTTGFTASFGTAAPSGATVDWKTFRSEV